MEEGKQEVKYSGGPGAFFYGLIPGVLGGAALLWLAFVSGCLDIQQQRTFASRMDNRVGVVEKLTSPVALKIQQPNCMAIQRAFIDGDTVTAYMHNGCSGRNSSGSSYWEWHVIATAPDGTIIGTWMENSLDSPPAGATIELKHEVAEDQRITTITVYSTNKN